MPTHRVALDFDKSFSRVRPEVTIRVGDKGEQRLITTLYDHGEPHTPKGVLKLQILTSSGALVRSQPMTQVEDPNVWTCVIPGQGYVEHGEARRAYVYEWIGGEDGNDGDSTGDIKLMVLPGTTDEEAVRYFDAQIEQDRQTLADNEEARQSAERERKANELIRQSQEETRQSQEETREANEEIRKKAEDRREKQERERLAAERKRDQAEKTREQEEESRKTAEEGRVEAETGRTTAEELRVGKEAARKAAEELRKESEDARELAERERESSETGRADAEAKRIAAETVRQTQEETRQTVEQARKAAEELRAEAEGKREVVETARVSAEDARKAAEDLRATAEDKRAEADAEREERQAANDTQQAKNNADQAANNRAAQGLVWVELTEEQLDPETRVPSIEGEFGKLYFAPSENPLESDTATEWMWKPSGSGGGRWERVGTSEVIPPETIGTEKIDQIHGGGQLSGKAVMGEADLSYYQSLLAADHKEHERAQKAVDDAQDALISANASAVEAAVAKAEADLADAKAKQAIVDAAQGEAISNTAQLARDGDKELKTELQTWVADEAKAHAAGSADVAGKLGTSTVGGAKTAIWLDAGVPKAGAAIATEVATIEANGLLPKLSGDAGQVLSGAGTWVTVKTDSLSLSGVQAAVAAANAAKEGVVGSDLGGFGLTKGQRYVTSAQMQALESSITRASSPITTLTTQAMVDSYASDLAKATTTFSGQIQTAKWTSPENIASASWPEIIALCDTSKEDVESFYDYYKGQEKTFKLKTSNYGSDVTIRVADCGNMDLASGGKCGLYFVVVDGLIQKRMNSSNTTSGGYPNTEMHKTTCPAILADFPDELQGKFAKLKLHVHTSPSASSGLVEVECDAHCLTMLQVFGENNLKGSYSSQLAWWGTEEKWLRWYADHDTPNDRIFKHNGHAASSAWSSSVYDSYYFGGVSSNGAPDYNYASYTCVPALGFSLTNG